MIDKYKAFLISNQNNWTIQFGGICNIAFDQKESNKQILFLFPKITILNTIL
jgi:hypothetical protein